MASWQEFSAAELQTEVYAWSDGSSLGNPGPGGFGAILRYIDASGATHERELFAGYRHTTNNRMELMGAIAVLEALRRPCRIKIATDSQYVIKGFSDRWVEGWIRRGWKTASKKPVANVDLWQRLVAAMQPHQVSWEWVRGHAGHAENERCDRLAKTAAASTDLLEDEGYISQS